MGVVEQDDGCDVGKGSWRIYHGFRAWETPGGCRPICRIPEAVREEREKKE